MMRAMAEEALALHVEGMVEDGLPIPDPSRLEEILDNRTGTFIPVARHLIFTINPLEVQTKRATLFEASTSGGICSVQDFQCRPAGAGDRLDRHRATSQTSGQNREMRRP
jgi:hypothetical protein